jgi:hypothetical protein
MRNPILRASRARMAERARLFDLDSLGRAPAQGCRHIRPKPPLAGATLVTKFWVEMFARAPRHLAVGAILKPAANWLSSNGCKARRFEMRSLKIKELGLTLNQRVQGSSPCAPTRKINLLYNLYNCMSVVVG